LPPKLWFTYSAVPVAYFYHKQTEALKTVKKKILEEDIILTFIAYPRIKHVFFVACF